MIFQHTWRKVIDGSQTQKRMLVKPGEYALNIWRTPLGDDLHIGGSGDSETIGVVKHASWKDKWAVYTNTYAIQPGGGMRTVWFRELGDGMKTIYDDDCPDSIRCWSNAALKHDGWKPLRIQITRIRREQLHTITEEDAKAEGLTVKYDEYMQTRCWQHPASKWVWKNHYDAFADLWDRMHKYGSCWTDNPSVWVLEFKVVS